MRFNPGTASATHIQKGDCHLCHCLQQEKGREGSCVWPSAREVLLQTVSLIETCGQVCGGTARPQAELAGSAVCSLGGPRRGAPYPGTLSCDK